MMQPYINQLIEDLKQAAHNPPTPAYFEAPPHLEAMPEVAELALVPYKSLEELTGIQQESFPFFLKLNMEQCDAVNQAIFKVFESLHIELIDIPDGIPAEQLYDVLTINWQQKVQYLPSSGMDLELCTGNPKTCPYGEFCTCGEEIDEFDLPYKFNAFITPIVEAIDSGSVCYLNPKTMEMEELRQLTTDNPHGYQLIKEPLRKEHVVNHKTWDKYYKFTPLNSDELFQLMANFVYTIDDNSTLNEFLDVLYDKKPLNSFNRLISRKGFSIEWSLYKTQELEKHVKTIIFDEINHIKLNINDNHDFDELPF